MKRIVWVMAVLAAAAGLAACGKKEPESKTMKYFMQHKGEIDKVIADCKNRGFNPLASTPEARTCDTAYAASRERSTQSMK